MCFNGDLGAMSWAFINTIIHARVTFKSEYPTSLLRYTSLTLIISIIGPANHERYAAG
jgi:hypothetical protein